MLTVCQILPAPPSSLALAAKPHHVAMSIDASPAPLSTPTDAADDLTATNVPDPLSNEQTWPTDEEMASANGVAAGSRGGRRVKRVPKGTSAYQAAWIFDDEDGGEDEDDGEDRDTDAEGEERGSLNGNGMGEDVEEDTEEVELDSRRSEVHRDLDADEEEAE